MNKNENKLITDLTYLEEISYGDHEFIKNMINTFLNETPQHFENLSYYYKNNEWRNFKDVAHKMKPVFQMVGLNSDFFEELQNDANQGKIKIIGEKLNQLEETINKASSELKEKVQLY